MRDRKSFREDPSGDRLASQFTKDGELSALPGQSEAKEADFWWISGVKAEQNGSDVGFVLAGVCVAFR